MFGEYAVFSELCNGDILMYEKIEKEPFTAVLNELRYRKAKNNLQNYLLKEAQNKS